MAEKVGVEMPIVNAVYETLFNGKAPEKSINELMQRELKSEVWYCIIERLNDSKTLLL